MTSNLGSQPRTNAMFPLIGKLTAVEKCKKGQGNWETPGSGECPIKSPLGYGGHAGGHRILRFLTAAK